MPYPVAEKWGNGGVKVICSRPGTPVADVLLGFCDAMPVSYLRMPRLRNPAKAKEGAAYAEALDLAVSIGKEWEDGTVTAEELLARYPEDK